MDKTKRFLDPIIAVREPTDGAAYWTPNGYHRLTALKELGAKSVLALLVPERAVAYQILALNIEKAHNLREKAIGVRRMYLDLLEVGDDEESYALEFEEPALATLKSRGFNSPYLRAFVVARTNPLRFIKGTPPPLEELLPSMRKRAAGMDASKIKSEDVARTGGAPEASAD